MKLNLIYSMVDLFHYVTMQTQNGIQRILRPMTNAIINVAILKIVVGMY